MIQQSDIEGRLNLLRYGLVVLVVVAFLVALLAPFAALRNIEGVSISITDFLDEAIIAAIIVAILSAIVYYAYGRFLDRTVENTKMENAEASA